MQKLTELHIIHFYYAVTPQMITKVIFSLSDGPVHNGWCQPKCLPLSYAIIDDVAEIRMFFSTLRCPVEQVLV